jgi:hypothetical protein
VSPTPARKATPSAPAPMVSRPKGEAEGILAPRV